MAKLHEVHVEEEFTPNFRLLDQPNKQVFSNKPATSQSYLGADIQIDDKGNLIRIIMTTGVVANNLEELFNYSDKGDCILVYNMVDLDVLVKELGTLECRALLEGKAIRYKGIQIRYTPQRLISMWAGKKSIRVNSLKYWFRQFSLDKARDMVGLDGTYNQEQDKVLHLWASIYKASKHLWESSFPGVVYGPALIAKPVLDRALSSIDLGSIPIEAQEMAYNCIHAPWVDIFVKGTIPYGYDYDLNSAYPTEIANLLLIDYYGGNWWYSHEYETRSAYGFCQAVISIKEDAHISPIRLRFRRRHFSPTGTWVGYITKQEIDFIRRYKLGTVEVLNGWWFKPKRPFKPFRKPTLSYIAERAAAKQDGNKPLSYALKMSAASIYGRFLQKRQTIDGDWVASPSFCPIYACIVMTQVKLRTASLLFRKKDYAASVTVDGFVTTTPIESRYLKGAKLEAKGTTTLMAPLLYNMPNRGSAVNIKDMIAQDPYATSFKITIPKRTSLCEGLAGDRLDLVGREADVEQKFLVSQPYGRDWTSLPLTAGDLLTDRYNSTPMHIDTIVWRDWING